MIRSVTQLISPRKLAVSAAAALVAGGVVGTVAVTTLGPAAATASPGATTVQELNVNGVYVHNIKFNGTVMSLDAFSQRSAELQTKGQPTYQYADPRAASVGYILGTTDGKQFDKWVHSVKVNPTHVGIRGSANASVTSQSGTSGASCNVYTHGFNATQLYDNTDCTGAKHEFIFAGDKKPNVLYDNTYSSLQFGCNNSTVTLFQNTYYNASYGKFAFGNPDGTDYYVLNNYHWDNNVNHILVNDSTSSYSSVASGVTCSS